MAALYEGPVQVLMDEFGRLPGIGPKSAQRIVFYLLKRDRQDSDRLANALVAMKDRIGLCEECFNIAEGPRCGLCNDERRDHSVICVVEEPRDVVAIERTGEFRGRYHVLHGAIAPMDGVGPEQLHIRELLRRLDGVNEVIVATNPNIEGEATAMYVARLLEPLNVRVSRLASGLPVGGDLEYADEVTLGRAFTGRRNVDAGR